MTADDGRLTSTEKTHPRWWNALPETKYVEHDPPAFCGSCRDWIPVVAGDAPSGWGACSSAQSAVDGRATFRKYGCQRWVRAELWYERSLASEMTVSEDDLRNAIARGWEPPPPNNVRDPLHLDTTATRWRRSLPVVGVGVELACGGCGAFAMLAGAFVDEWGTCAEPASSRDGCVVHSAYGCEQHRPGASFTAAIKNEYR